MTRLADTIGTISTKAKTVEVQVSYDVVKLFSEQLYASPAKAIEELVVNSWDAEAGICSILVDLTADKAIIAVFDDGKGMDLRQLEDLWHIGISKKLAGKSTRKQIGKFGIGKLASYAVARRATYISKTLQGINGVTIDFEDFAAATDKETGLAKPVTLQLRTIAALASLESSDAFKTASLVLSALPKSKKLKDIPTWTFVVLEDLKDKAHQLSTRRLNWILQTAMPLASDFKLFLNGSEVVSSKQTLDKVVSFTVDQIDDDRLADLEPKTGEKWTRIKGGIKSVTFPNGITGNVIVTRQSLYAPGGKSEDLGRSHGFFVRVHNRLINEVDPLFGARPLSFSTWNHFAAEVEADDLNPFITAARDSIEQSAARDKILAVLIQLFNEARERYEAVLDKEAEANSRKKEGSRDYVSTELVERPLADALIASPSAVGTPAGADWRIVEPVADIAELQGLVEALYAAERKNRQYVFKYSPVGSINPLARLNAKTATFVVNEDHPLVREFSERPESKRLLEAVIVAEALLEAYLRIADVPPEIVGDVLDRRDNLLRSLAEDESYSLKALASALREATDNEHDLEVALVGALRALGFNARHISGSGEPDGEANYLVHGAEEVSFTLEAKSSGQIPQLSQLDFAGLRSHYEEQGANGCLLVAPSFPAASDPNGEVSKRAKQQKVSCWTIEQLARVVEAAERRHINARKLQTIVLSEFTPIQVTAAVEKLLSDPSFDQVDLYLAILSALQTLEGRLKGSARNVSMIAVDVIRDNKFADVEVPQIQEAIADLASISKGMLHANDKGEVFVLGDLKELRRRVSSTTGEAVPPRRRGTFRSNGDSTEPK